MKILLILMTLLFAAIVGVLGAFIMMRPDDANYIVAYTQMTPEDRDLARKAVARVHAVSGKEQAEFDKLYVNDDIKKRFADAKTPEAVQQLMVAALQSNTAMIDAKNREWQAAAERLKMRNGEYRDFESRLEMERATLKTDKESLDREKREWMTLQMDETLKQFVQDVNSTEKKYDKISDRFKLLPVMQQAFVFKNAKNGIARDNLFAALSDEQKNALTKLIARMPEAAPAPMGAAGTSGNATASK